MNKSYEKKFKKLVPLSSLQEAVEVSIYMLGILDKESFSDFILRNEKLIVQDGSQAKVQWVKDFLMNLYQAVEDGFSVHVSSYVFEKLRIIEIINYYFSNVIDWRYSTDAAKIMSPSMIVSAALVRGVEDYLVVIRKTREEIEKAAVGENVIDAQRSYLITDSRGVRAHPDTALLGIFNSIFLVLKSTAFIERFQKGKDFDFQVFTQPEADDLYKISALNFNAMSWSYFDDLQKDIRHCGRSWTFYDNNDEVPEEYKASVNNYLEVGYPVLWKKYELIAEHRFRQLAREIFINAFQYFKLKESELTSFNVKRLASSIVIDRTLSVDPDDETNKCLGLTLAQWLCGYDSLQSYIQDVYVEDDINSLIPFLSRAEILSILVEKGMKTGVAETFLDNVMFGPASIDLYDTPVIRFDDKYMLYGPALKDAMLHELVISNVSRNKEKLTRKGGALEDKLFSVLIEAGLDPKKIKEKRGKEEYEFDVVVQWENVLFVFECKNRAIPKSPILSRNMMDDYSSHVKQLYRLCEALKKHPDILKKHFGKECHIEKIVPCIVNGMPLSLDFKLNDVFVTDMIGIFRFFSDKDVVFHSSAGEEEVYSQWSDVKPSLSDFLFYLNNPYQVGLSDRCFNSSHDAFLVGNGSCVKVGELLYEDKGYEDALVYFSWLSEYKSSLASN